MLKLLCLFRHRKHVYRYTQLAIDLGAKIIAVPLGRLSRCASKAKYYALNTDDARMVPLGCNHRVVVDAIAEYASYLVSEDLIEVPSQVWTAISSGTLSRGLQKAWPDTEFHGVVVGYVPNEKERGRAILHYAPEKYEQKARKMPPFDSCYNYDAKAWQFIVDYANPGALFWNVAGS